MFKALLHFLFLIRIKETRHHVIRWKWYFIQTNISRYEVFQYIMTIHEIMKIGKTKDLSSHADLKEYSNSNF